MNTETQISEFTTKLQEELENIKQDYVNELLKRDEKNKNLTETFKNDLKNDLKSLIKDLKFCNHEKQKEIEVLTKSLSNAEKIIEIVENENKVLKERIVKLGNLH